MQPDGDGLAGRRRIHQCGHGLQSGADVATVDGYPGLAAIFLAVGVNAALLGGGGRGSNREGRRGARAGPAVWNARGDRREPQLPRADVGRIDPARARALLQESIERSATLGRRAHRESSPHAWRQAGSRTGISLSHRRPGRCGWSSWSKAPLQVAPCLALVPGALAEDRPGIAGVLHGAAYATFKRAASEASRRVDRAPLLSAQMPTSS